MLVADSGTRRFTLIGGGGASSEQAGLAAVVTLQRRAAAGASLGDARTLFQDTLAEYCWARDVAGLAATTLNRLVQPVIEVCSFYDVVPWELSSRALDKYFAGPGKRAHSTNRRKITLIDHYFAFLEQRYAGEIARRFGAVVESPVDAFNRPRHRGDFGLRIPPSPAEMKAFFAAWRQEPRQARKYPVAARSHVMSKVAYVSGVRATELRLVRLGDLFWDQGQWGRFLAQGKGARGSGPRERMAFMFTEVRGGGPGLVPGRCAGPVRAAVPV
ncbi:hypothetical protein ACWGE1_34295 [Streptomyces sp. NPDC054932]